ncbi:MAG: hypothetical protein HZB66_01115 [Candidatus Aenigmarchaeota archaeon]|nr:hypothetical protein [Candidatus Aenigmarchaeota archaeon]
MDIQEISERLDRLENRIKINFFEIEKKFAKISPEGGSEEMVALKERIQEIEDLQMYLELENIKLKEKMSDAGPSYSSDVEDRLKRIEEKSGGHVVVHDKKVPENVISQIEQLKEDMGRIGSSKEMREAVNLLGNRMDAVENMVDQLGDLIKSSEQVSLAKGLDEIRRFKTELGSVMKAKENVIEHLNQMSAQIDRTNNLVTAMEELEKKAQKDMAILEDMKKSVYAELETHPHEKTADLAQKVSILEEKIKSEMQQMQVVRSRINEISSKTQSDYKTNVDERIKQLEKDMELKAQTFLSENLKRFAKTLDEKVPQLLSETYLTQKIVEAQSNLAPIERQMDDLRSRIDYIEKRMRGLHSSIPVIVE